MSKEINDNIKKLREAELSEEMREHIEEYHGVYGINLEIQGLKQCYKCERSFKPDEDYAKKIAALPSDSDISLVICISCGKVRLIQEHIEKYHPQNRKDLFECPRCGKFVKHLYKRGICPQCFNAEELQ